MKKHLQKISSLFLSGIISWGTFAQSQQIGHIGSHNQEKCAFDHKHNELMQDPAYAQRMQNIENIAKQYVNSGIRTEAVYQIPVVFHVMHLNEPLGTGSNISDAQIQSCINHLNDVYRGNFGAAPLDLGVEFVLAQQDPDCNATTGILRYNASGVTGYSDKGLNRYNNDGADDTALQAIAPGWDETSYFNVWTVTEIDNNSGGAGIQGYANFYSGSSGEGSFMMHTVIGYDTDGSEQWGYSGWGYGVDNSTPVHEFGHYFHLYHTFQGDSESPDTCPPAEGDCSSEGDECCDTELHMRETSSTPTAGVDINSCTGAAYGANVAYNWMSYYNNTDRLTNDQKTRVRSILETSMAGLINSKGLQAPGAPFSPPVANSCTPQTDVAWGLDGNYSGIGKVEIKDMINSSGYPLDDNPSTGTLDETANCQKLIALDLNETVTLKVTTKYNSGNYIKAYIDYDNSGSFTAGEEVWAANNIAANTEASNNFIVPGSATTGTTLRMRIIQDLGTISGPCHNSTYGQAEDYSVYINAAGPSCNMTLNSTMQQSSCSDDDGSIDLTVSNGTAPYTYLWSNAATTQDLAGLSAASYTVTVTDNNACSETHTKAVTQNCQPVPTTSITPSYCGTTPATYNDNIYCDNIGAASEYEFKLVNGGTTLYHNNTVPFFRFYYINGIQPNTTYSVSVRVKISGTWGSYGNACDVTTPNVTAPDLLSSYCNTTLTSYFWDVYCDQISGASEYEFRIVNGGTILYHTAISNKFRPYHFTGIQPNTTYSASVRAKVGGTWGPYGNTCNITTPNLDGPNIQTPWCNYTATSSKDRMWAYSVKSADAYEFQFVDGGTTLNLVKYSTAPNFRFNQVSGAQPNTTYSVSVRARVAGVWGSYGTPCDITTPGSLRLAGPEEDGRDFTVISLGDLENISLITYPNPTSGAFTLNLEGLEEYASTIRIDVFDMYGKQVHVETLYNQSGGTISTINENGEFANGIYLISVSVDGHNFQQKVVVQ